MIAIEGYREQELLRDATPSMLCRAVRASDNRPVILKLLKPGPWSAEYKSHYLHDFDVCSALELDCVVKPYALDEQEGHLVLAFEDFGGFPLSSLMAERRLTLGEVLSTIAMAAGGLHDIHRRGVAHRAVSPANLICDLGTPRLKLAGFGVSSALTRETPSSSLSKVPEFDMAYVSPEQTGRMNRSVDYRTDLYSLGVVMYECLTGRLPFESTDDLELVYCHLAEEPPPPERFDAGIPQQVSKILLRLLAKPPEERYQSAYGLVADLRECERQLAQTGTIQAFPLGARDISGRLLIPEKLYGRTRETERLIEAFDRVSQGRAEMVLVAGYSGIGKSALVNEVHTPIARQRGYFISGKFDQFQRHIPYSSLIQAFRELVRLLLTETEENIHAWRRSFLDALGQNGQVIVDVIPEVELIIGPQPPVVRLPPNEAENRFSMVFRRFLRVLAQREHPLVLFLDDLQWADSASLKLIQLLVTDPDAAYLLVLGAFRDNEVSAAHPLRTTLAEVRASGAKTTTITLPALTLPHITELLSDTLRCETAQAHPLAELVLEKTAGNPFFLRQFVAHLHSEEYLTLDSKTGVWTWDVGKIRALGITDNVVDLMAKRILNLNPQTQEALKLAACIGNRFRLRVLSLVCGEPPAATAENLWEALQSDVVLPTSGGWAGPNLPEGFDPEQAEFAFLHDRVQEAAYALMPLEERKAVHLQIGRLMLDSASEAEREEKLFDIVNQLNTGAELIKEPEERAKLAALNLEAARKAKTAAAFGAARRYARAGVGLLAEDRWRAQYRLALDLHLETVEAEYLNVDIEEALRVSEIVLAEAKTLLDKVPVYVLQVEFLITRNQMEEAIEAALPVVDELGYPISRDPADLMVTRRLPTPDDLECAPRMTDPRQLAALHLLTIITGAAYQGKPEVFPPVVLKIIDLCLDCGLSPLAANGFAVYGTLLCGPLGDIEKGSRAGGLALRLLEEFQTREHKCKVRMAYDSFIRPWREHHRSVVQALDETIQTGLETGDFVYATYCCIWSSGYLFVAGHPLGVVEEKQSQYAKLMMKLKQENGLYPAKIWRQLALNLLGHASDPQRLEGESLGEDDLRHVEEMNVVLTQFFLHFAQMILAYVFRQFPAALTHARNAAKLESSAISSALEGGFVYYDSLARLAMCARLNTTDREAALARVEVSLQRIRVWAEHGPMNYRSKLALVEAEKANVLGQTLVAMAGYDHAIDLAQENEFPLEQAIALERAADFYLGLGHERIAKGYLRKARDAYEKWGARAKAADLEKQFGAFLPRLTPTTSPVSQAEGPAGQLDAMTLIMASQALSSEIELSRLLAKLVRLALENAGAQRGVLVLNRDGDSRVEAIATHNAEDTEVLQAIPLAGCRAVPETIVRYVIRTGERVVLADAAREGMYIQDPYVAQHQSRSVLCIPIHHHDRVTAVLYLENELAANVFTEERLDVLHVLLTQAAISLENAELFDSRKRAEQALRESEERMRVVLDALPAGVFLMDPKNGTIVDVNPAAAEMIGLPGNEIRGKECQQFVCSPGESDNSGGVSGSEAGHVERILVTGDGEEKPILVTTRAVRIGKKERLLESFVDISERKQLEVQLRQAQKMEAVGQLAGGVAHDFNNLLQAIQGYTDMAMEELSQDNAAYADLSEVQKASQRAAALIRQLLAFSRREAIRPRRLDLVEVVGNLTKMLHRVIGEHVELSVTHAPNLRAVHADAGQLEQVLMNLCVNARDAMPEGGRIVIETANASIDAPFVEHHAWAEAGEYVLLTVSDTGEGMPPEIAEHVFEPFFTTKGVGKGTGMGLATVYGIVKQHEGLIQVYSEPGHGTVFRVYLPVSQSDTATNRLAEVQEEPVRGGNETILLAEDEGLVRNMVAQVLRKAGYNVVTVKDGAEAIELFETKGDSIDLFLLDVIMPKKSGRAVFDLVKAARPDALVLFSSGYSHNALGASSLPEEGYELIPKPHSPNDLLRKVRDLLDGRN